MNTSNAMTPILRLGVIERGDAAVRVFQASAALNQGGGAAPITSVLFHTEPESEPWFGREADAVVALGPQPSVDEVVAALQHARIDTVWLGTWPHGPVGTRAELIAGCEAGGLAVMGPDAAAVRRLADPRQLAELRFVGAAPAPGAATRRLEVEVLADRHGTVWVLGMRDASLRLAAGAPLLAEEPAAIGEGLAERIRAAARALALALPLRGAAVLQVVHDGERFALDGIDTAVAPHHATAQERRGVSLDGWRLRIQRGEALPATEPAANGVALEARVLAEGPNGTALGAATQVAALALPRGTGVRIDANRRVGDPVRPEDPLLAVFTAWGPDRPSALDRLRRALERSAIVIDGAACNRTRLVELLQHERIAKGEPPDDGWLEREGALNAPVAPQPVALLAAAVEAYEADRSLAQAAFYATAVRGRPEQPADVGARIELDYAGVSYRLEVDNVGPRRYTVRQGNDSADVALETLDNFERRLTCGGRRHALLVVPTDAGYRIELGGQAHAVERADGVAVRSDRPALVVALHVAPGSVVAEGDPIAVLESMKMESTFCAPMAGEVVALGVSPNVQVEAGALLVRLRARRGDVSPTPAAPAARVSFAGLEQPVDFTRRPCERVYGPLGDYLLGHDLAGAPLAKLLTQQKRMAEIAEASDPHLLACEDSLIDLYADLGALYRPQAEPEPDELAARRENTQEALHAFLQWLDADRAGLAPEYRTALLRALGRYGVDKLDRTPALQAAAMRLFRSFARLTELSPVVSAILQRRMSHRDALLPQLNAAARDRLDRLAGAMQGRQQGLADLARDLRFHCFDEPPMEAAAAALRSEMAGHLQHLAREPQATDRAARIERLVQCPQSLGSLLLEAWRHDGAPSPALTQAVLEVHVRRYYRIGRVGPIEFGRAGAWPHMRARVGLDDGDIDVVVAYLPLIELPDWCAALAPALAAASAGGSQRVIDVVAWRHGERQEIGELAAEVAQVLQRCRFGSPSDAGAAPLRVDLAVADSQAPPPLRTRNVSFARGADGVWTEQVLYREMHPMLARRLELWRLGEFELERRPAPPDVHLYQGVARQNKDDKRLFALAQVRELDALRDPVSGEVSYPRLEHLGLLAMAAMRTELSRYSLRDRPVANRLVLDVEAPWMLPPEQVLALAQRFASMAARAGLEKVVLKVRRPDTSAPGGVAPAVLQFGEVGGRVLVTEGRAGTQAIRPLSAYQQKVLAAARAGSPYPYEIVRLLTQAPAASGLPPDHFEELDLDEAHRLVPVQREPGRNRAHIVVGLITNHTPVVPEGMTRVAMLSDPTQGLGNLSEPECRRINAALAYALQRRIPVEWFAISSGALIAMDSGTENMDWIARTLRALIEYTQAGGEINIVVTGINVGGQPYWNAEATMLMHTKGILVMTPASAMVLTGKQALDYSGAVSADDNFGIGGYDRVMGPNGQAQYFAPSFPEACKLLLEHYAYTYVVPGERFPRRRPSTDPVTRDVCASPHAELAGSPFRTVGDLFSHTLNAERKQPFDMRSVMRAVADADHAPLERWKDLRDGDTVIVWDAAVGGFPVLLLGIESHKVARKGFVAADGPPAWTSGTLFPQSSRKAARAINAASGNRPLVVLANLSGFDGSPESMRSRQLEYGAEIGRAVTNFDGPIVFVVVSRYHGGAFVVFSKALNDAMQIAAVEGSVASVIGGTPAAATVFAREVKLRTDNDPRIKDARKALAAASGAAAARLRSALAATTEQVRSEKLGEVAGEFDGIHTVERALRVGSVDRIIRADQIRPYVVGALEQGMRRFVT
jgi:acetyl/propionyl-CoA carboxylase alpha subunit/acetyl-CoA carboxylase carboxyltransferase component